MVHTFKKQKRSFHKIYAMHNSYNNIMLFLVHNFNNTDYYDTIISENDGMGK